MTLGALPLPPACVSEPGDASLVREGVVSALELLWMHRPFREQVRSHALRAEA
ncbi:hypothetical protein ALQ53_01240 [Pseudomonas cannabina]|uniref:Uncharacterized protein n=1 Tax=Pseudomonas cannabina TaxID=86840 RepID=A0A3M3RSJ3_PSECA|nr:hypothetical protein ALQ53_01240 [Pseudomonas cannabina]RMN99385.1 hypothetical protein ALQ51_02598 [Pseudomonas cannabina]